MKKNIAILICGEIRNNWLGDGTDTVFINNFKKNVLNEDVLNNYNVNIFFVTDRINEKKAYNYFGEKLKGLLQLSFQDIDEPLNLDTLIKNYLNYYNYRKSNDAKFKSTFSREKYVYKYYKVYSAYKLMKKYETNNSIIHDYIFNIRPDISINSNLYNDLILLETKNFEMMFYSEAAEIGKYEIMSHICNLIFVYGKYNYGEIKHEINYTRSILHSDIDYLELRDKIFSCWTESPEVQLFEHVLEYVYRNNINYDKLYPHLNLSFIK